jgi:hypothetical protein
MMSIVINEEGSHFHYDAGYIGGLLTARYHALRHAANDDFFDAPAPRDVPEVVDYILENFCRECVERRIFEAAWAGLDDVLRCSSIGELEAHLDVDEEAQSA